MKTRKTEREKLKEDVRINGAMLSSYKTTVGRLRWFLIIIATVIVSLLKLQIKGSVDMLVMAMVVLSITVVIRILSESRLHKGGKRLIPEATLGEMWALLSLTLNLSGETRLLARMKLLELLSHLNEDDNILIDVIEQHEIAYALSTKDKELVLALLSAVAKIGNVEGMRAVRALSQGKHLALTDLEVREAAAFCLSQLEARLEQNKHNRVLLRPSVSPIEPETLLRPVVTALPEEPQVLLRSGEKPE